MADAVKADRERYNEAFLGKPVEEYARWILDPSKWGGAIELSILSKWVPGCMRLHSLAAQLCTPCCSPSADVTAIRMLPGNDFVRRPCAAGSLSAQDSA